METSGASPHKSMVDRIKAIILKPKEEWPVIEAEPATQGGILTKWVMPLAAIGPVATLVGTMLFGLGGIFVTIRPSFTSALGTAIATYVLSIVAVFVLALIADWLAPKFEGQSNKLNAFKLIAYGMTAAWLAGILGLIPSLGLFSIIGAIYSIYLVYLGSGPLMKVPEQKQAGFAIVLFLIAFVLNLIVGIIVGAVIGVSALTGGAASSYTSGSSDDDVTISIPGVGSIDTGEMNKAAERMEKVQRGEIRPVETQVLQAMLPEQIGQFQRTGLSSRKMGGAGSGVEGTYKAGDYRFDLRVNDMLALSGIAGMGAAMGIESSEEDENGYKRMGTVDGQWRSEEWNSQRERGEYAVMVANRFQVLANGNVPSIDVLKQAVAQIDQGDLEDMAE
ncbi:hypothetical protein GCM10011371_02490 [Novosphingobium marinum]|uniref:Yip1 domain-containing protein n=1 Tax=Novosphingobium marinum TaxID=1514948 RepID=A0A7Y9XSW6_9SPHN|nr:Yip1 family protein [Novosphingobium marinum]NYH93940.1 hypothetical protein [Novosphingobium marinum]GGC18437.1 hypothetical protein GCM10011371_02490 [Novosphingobium marinum]